MKKLLLFYVAIVFAMSLQAQYVVINSPDDLSGSYVFEVASFGAALTDSVWMADAVFVDDGMANPNEGCGPSTNGEELAGKVALVDRGGCQFGTKALNAENAGAIAVIIFNHNNGAEMGAPVGMAPGDEGGQVTVPVVMLSYQDGQTIRAAMADGAVPNFTLGDVRFPNDVSIGLTSVITAPLGTIALSQLDESFVVNPGALITNRGTEDANDIVISATITQSPLDGGDPTQVYSESDNAGNLLSDSVAFVVLPEFTPAASAGIYNLSYQVNSDTEDDIELDNEFETTFYVLDQDVMSRARWNLEDNRPVQTNAYTPSGGGGFEFLSSFYFPNGMGYRLDSVEFYAAVPAADATFAEEILEVYVYSWDDLNTDGVYDNGELEIVALGTQVFADTVTATQAWVTIPLLDFETLEDPGYVIPEDDAYYVVGVRYPGENTVFIGFDEGNDQTQFVQYKLATETIQDSDYPYIGTTTFDNLLPSVDDGFLFTDFRASLSTTVHFSSIETSSISILTDEVQLSLYPSPATDRMTSEIALETVAQKMELQIVNVNGQVIFRTTKQNVLNDKSTFDVSRLATGQYFLKVVLAEGIKTVPFSVQR